MYPLAGRPISFPGQPRLDISVLEIAVDRSVEALCLRGRGGGGDLGSSEETKDPSTEETVNAWVIQAII
jgi:hypothetical protein